MKKYKLSELFDLQMGKTPARNNPQFWDDGENPWISIADMSSNGKYIITTKECITDCAVRETGIKPIFPGTVIMSFKLSVGKVAIVRTPYQCYSNEAIIAFEINDNISSDDQPSSEYIYYLISSMSFDALGNKAVMGKTLNKSILSEIIVNVHDKEQRNHIVDVLTKCDDLIDCRKQQLSKLDELVKSRFIEMFGDPIYNEKRWLTDSVENVCSDIYGGGTPSKAHPEYYENGDIPWVSSKDMKSSILYDSQIRINQLGVDNSTAKIVPINSVIMVIRSGILKHTLPVAINAVPITVNQDLKVFVPSQRITSLFLMYLFKMLEKDILSGVRAVTADNIEFNSLKERMIIVPPIDLQLEFVTFVEQTDKSKLAIQKSLEKLETLKKALMQKYFG